MNPEITGFEDGSEVRQDGRDDAHLGNGIKVNVAQVRVGKEDVGRECAEDNVTQLDASRWYDVTECKVILADELREVVE